MAPTGSLSAVCAWARAQVCSRLYGSLWSVVGVWRLALYSRNYAAASARQSSWAVHFRKLGACEQCFCHADAMDAEARRLRGRGHVAFLRLCRSFLCAICIFVPTRDKGAILGKYPAYVCLQGETKSKCMHVLSSLPILSI
jgi:hypothetical protein